MAIQSMNIFTKFIHWLNEPIIMDQPQSYVARQKEQGRKRNPLTGKSAQHSPLLQPTQAIAHPVAKRRDTANLNFAHTSDADITQDHYLVYVPMPGFTLLGAKLSVSTESLPILTAKLTDYQAQDTADCIDALNYCDCIVVHVRVNVVAVIDGKRKFTVDSKWHYPKHNRYTFERVKKRK
jgi:hypothetical protein